MKKDSAARSGEAGMGFHLRFPETALEVVGEIARNIASPMGNVDYAIDDSLLKIGDMASASRAYVMQEEKDGKYLRVTHEWVSSKAGATMFSWPLYDYDLDVPSLKRLAAEKDYFFGHSREMPSDLGDVLTKQGVYTFAMATIIRDGERIGLLGLDFCEQEFDFCAELGCFLKCSAGIVSMALERKNSQLMRSKLLTIREAIAPLDTVLKGYKDNEQSIVRQSKPTTLLDAERRIIMETLELYSGNKLKAAKHLGLTWPSLDRRCKKLGIEARRR